MKDTATLISNLVDRKKHKKKDQFYFLLPYQDITITTLIYTYL